MTKNVQAESLRHAPQLISFQKKYIFSLNIDEELKVYNCKSQLSSLPWPLISSHHLAVQVKH